MTFSLQRALTGLWVVILLLCLALGFLLFGLFDQGVGAQLRQGNQRLDQAIDNAARRYVHFVQSFNGQPAAIADPQVRAELEMMATVALAGYEKVEGGFWSRDQGSVAYAFPTHEGPTIKTDLPAAELGQIKQVIEASLAAGKPTRRRFDSEHASLLLEARPLPGPPSGMAVWVMTRAPLDVGQFYQRFAFALAVLLLLGLGSGAWLLGSLRRWTRRIGALEEAIASTPLEQLPALALTGERDLDRVVGALNQLNARLKTARDEGGRLTSDLARADRLVALGRMAAGLTHEIGNPLAAMRLRAENALAAVPERARESLGIILGQITRLEELLGALRLLTNSVEIRPQPVALDPFLRGRLEALAPVAAEADVRLTLAPSPPPGAAWKFDEKSLARALENLLLNAVQHAPARGIVRLGVECAEESCRFLVADNGPGVSLGEAERIFEPFVTTRADGVGLGLALVREIAQAHGGRAGLEPRADDTAGALFVIEIPHGENPDR